MKKKMIITLIGLVIGLTYQANAFLFTDISGHWAEESIYQVAFDVPVFSGYPDGTFRPDDTISRAEYVTMISKVVEILGLTGQSSTSSATYSDLTPAHWAYQSIQQVHHLMNGNRDTLTMKMIFDEDLFHPNTPITRLEVVLITHSLTTPPIAVEDNIHFADIQSTDIHANRLHELAANGIISGYEDGTFRPDALLTRAEAAILAGKLFQNLSYLQDNRLEIIYLEESSQSSYPVFDMPKNRNNYSDLDRKMDHVIATLEYRDIVGFIPFDERDLYDPDPIETLWQLKNQDYENVLANNYYLLVYDQSINPLRRVELATEALQRYMQINPIDVQGFLAMAFEVQTEAPNTLFVSALQRHRQSQLERQERIKSTILLSKLLFDQKQFSEAAQLYVPLIENETDIPTLLVLIQNEVYIRFVDQGADRALEQLNTYWEKMKANSRYWFFEPEVEEHLTGLGKQIIIHSQ